VKERVLPLGVDIGTLRVRVAALLRQANGGLRLLGVGAADVDGDVAEAIRLALSQVATVERRCVASIRVSDARLRCVSLPSMSGRELRQALRFEGISMFGESVEANEIVVRSSTLRVAEEGRHQTLVAAAPIEKVKRTLTTLAACGLRATSVDHEACVLARAAQTPLLDVGGERSSFIVVSHGMPVIRSFELGGSFFTDALAREFGTSLSVAETRKRTVGLAGAATEAVHTYVRALGAQLEGIELASATLYVCGNGSRLSDLRERIAETLGLRVLPANAGNLVECEVPAEVAHSGGYDWFSAIASALPSQPARAA
jgi:Tfp pilus assembly PilM family ATPase